MYKAIQNKKYYLAVNTFRKSAKKAPFNNAYLNGFRKWSSDDSENYALVIGTFRIIFAFKKQVNDCCNN